LWPIFQLPSSETKGEKREGKTCPAVMLEGTGKVIQLVLSLQKDARKITSSEVNGIGNEGTMCLPAFFPFLISPKSSFTP
jgi:hypothetical protein